mmetsp:Transcript_18156/g.41679  ORF Transcript_18156/g.41679 Transcript_18156/m.41679 type:complete len:206 (+) Transcript_18156:731-1348(+)
MWRRFSVLPLLTRDMRDIRDILVKPVIPVIRVLPSSESSSSESSMAWKSLLASCGWFRRVSLRRFSRSDSFLMCVRRRLSDGGTKGINVSYPKYLTSFLMIILIFSRKRSLPLWYFNRPFRMSGRSGSSCSAVAAVTDTRTKTTMLFVTSLDGSSVSIRTVFNNAGIKFCTSMSSEDNSSTSLDSAVTAADRICEVVDPTAAAII